MKGLPESPADYFDKFDTAPVSITPFDPRSTEIAAEYLVKLRDLFGGLDVELAHRGSTAFGIAGKGDVEVGVYPSDEAWGEVLERLEDFCGQAGNVEENYVRFNDAVDEYEIEIIVLRGYEARVDKRLTEYLMGHTELLGEYEKIKRRYAYSRREYQRAKDRFLRAVVEMIPDEQSGG
jgi:GrpB-like predicted nucleotidyltransferase (UPF0157 family)